ncbi:MAG: sulfite exporter TauE/SafE family protein [Flavobacteriales bacterium]
MKIISHDKKVKMELQNIIILAIIGIASGILSGTMGLGGAIIIIPALVMVLGFSQQMAQGTTLMMMVLPVGAMAAYHYHQQGFVDIKASLIMGAFFFIGGYYGAKMAVNIPQDILKKVFALMLIIIAVKMLFFEKVQQ